MRPKQTIESPQRIDKSNLTRRDVLALLGGATIAGLLPACSRESGERETTTPTVGSSLSELPGDLHYRSLTEVARLIESRQFSPVELTRMMIKRIKEVDVRLKSYARLTADRAMMMAHRAEREIADGNYRGPLHGIPVAVKDLCYAKGAPTMGGMAVYRDFVPDHDATVVSRLEQAGAVLLGKLNLTEGAMAGYHSGFDIPVNPWGADLWAGASSSGSGVATAAGLCFAALGTDTGGSIRFPSMANGIVGLKPTYGRVSRYGVLPLGETLDHVGPMTRRTADAAIVLQAIAGYDENDPTSLREPVPDLLAGLDAGIEGFSIGYDRAFATEGTDPGLVAAIDRALEALQELGGNVVEVRMPEGIREKADTWFAICTYEAHKAHAANFPTREDEYGPYFRHFLRTGAGITDEQYAVAGQQRAAFNRGFNEVLQTVDALVCPSGGMTFAVERDIQYGGTEDLQPLFDAVQLQFTIPANFAGTPTLTVCCGFSDAGEPYAFQFMGRRLSEALLCRFGHAYEKATGWHEIHPDV